MSTITLSTLAQTKMALHSARHGFSPIHGILIGNRQSSSPPSLRVTDAVPVCHEVPTRPVVNMALRLVDIYLSSDNDDRKEDNVILGWYTANKNGGDIPNVSALRIVNSMSEQCSEEGGEALILVLVSPEREEGPLCTVFEKGNNGKTFTQKVDASRIEESEDDSQQVRDLIVRGIKEMSNFSTDYGEKNGLAIYDYVDHMSDYDGQSKQLDMRNWIENKDVADFVAGAEAR